MSENDENESNDKKKSGWLQSTANFFVILESALNIARYVSDIYYLYQNYKEDNEYRNANANAANANASNTNANAANAAEEDQFANENANAYANQQPPRSPSFPLNPPPDVEAENDKETCTICLTNKIRTVNLPCGHLVFCFQCSREFISSNMEHDCPICRKRIEQIRIVYN